MDLAGRAPPGARAAWPGELGPREQQPGVQLGAGLELDPGQLLAVPGRPGACRAGRGCSSTTSPAAPGAGEEPGTEVGELGLEGGPADEAGVTLPRTEPAPASRAVVVGRGTGAGPRVLEEPVEPAAPEGPPRLAGQRTRAPRPGPRLRRRRRPPRRAAASPRWRGAPGVMARTVRGWSSKTRWPSAGRHEGEAQRDGDHEGDEQPPRRSGRSGGREGARSRKRGSAGGIGQPVEAVLPRAPGRGLSARCAARTAGDGSARPPVRQRHVPRRDAGARRRRPAPRGSRPPWPSWRSTARRDLDPQGLERRPHRASVPRAASVAPGWHTTRRSSSAGERLQGLGQAWDGRPGRPGPRGPVGSSAPSSRSKRFPAITTRPGPSQVSRARAKPEAAHGVAAVASGSGRGWPPRRLAGRRRRGRSGGRPGRRTSAGRRAECLGGAVGHRPSILPGPGPVRRRNGPSIGPVEGPTRSPAARA